MTYRHPTFLILNMNAKASAMGPHKKSVEVGKSQLSRSSLIIPVGIILVALLLSSSGFDLLECVKWVGGVVTSGTSHIMSMFHLRMSVAACPPNIFTKTKSKPNSSSDWAIEFEKVERKLREIRTEITSQQILLREKEAEAKQMGVIVDEMLEQVVNMPLALTNDDKVVTYKIICQEMDHNKDPRDCFYNLAAHFYSFAPHFPESAPLLQNLKTDPVDVRIKFNNTLRGFVLPLLVVELEEYVKRFYSSNGSVSSPEVNPQEVHDLWIREMNKYHVDYSKIVPPNLSLESEGGFILKVNVANAPTLMNNGIESSRRRCHFRSWPALKLNTPNTILQPGKLIPGECWMFEGTMGDVVVKLPYLSHIMGFTLEHRNKTITQSGQVCSAPKHFQVLGLTSMAEHEINRGHSHNFGVFTYEDAKEKESTQYFPILNYISKPYSIVLLRILSNQGYEKHTCIYRFHVHGHVSFTFEELHSDGKCLIFDT
ncbi:unnamed protein product [Orchesella dallaii]|uniref:SUN domain-containing protein n=1 Tax=Orchesella dallaii TaxID=48710 RepID=A0ABP1RPF2_9HEXA